LLIIIQRLTAQRLEIVMVEFQPIIHLTFIKDNLSNLQIVIFRLAKYPTNLNRRSMIKYFFVIIIKVPT
jgi:hypothetical protein